MLSAEPKEWIPTGTIKCSGLHSGGCPQTELVRQVALLSFPANKNKARDRWHSDLWSFGVTRLQTRSPMAELALMHGVEWPAPPFLQALSLSSKKRSPRAYVPADGIPLDRLTEALKVPRMHSSAMNHIYFCVDFASSRADNSNAMV